jgi:hypothetical protein
MSPIWIVRLALIAALFVYLGFSRIVLSDRKRYHCILKNGPLNIVFVIIYNGLCYLAVGLHPDPRVIAKPVIFGGPLVANWYAVLGQVLILTSACLLVYTVVKRNAIGGQDTGGILIMGLAGCKKKPLDSRYISIKDKEININADSNTPIYMRMPAEWANKLEEIIENDEISKIKEDIALIRLANEAWENSYLEKVDPNDPIYKFMAKPNAEWFKVIGENERAVVLYNISFCQVAIANLNKRFDKLEKDVNDISRRSLDFNDIEVR